MSSWEAAEPLEPRRLFAATLLLEGGTLRIDGTAGGDTVCVRVRGASLQVVAGHAVVATYASKQVNRVEVYGGDGDDRLTADASVLVPVMLNGGTGADTLTALGNRKRTLVDESAGSVVWAGPGATVRGRGVVNRVGAFRNDSSARLVGRDGRSVSFGFGDLTREIDRLAKQTEKAAKSAVNSTGKAASKAGAAVAEGAGAVVDGVMKIVDPAVTSAAFKYASFSASPLFGPDNSPSPSDANQGYLKDCYLVAALSSVAQFSPDVIRQTVTDLGDGTFAVRLVDGNGAKNNYRVDADLPTRPGGTLSQAYARSGESGAVWVGVVEKAFATAQGGTYASLDRGGWMSDVYRSLGLAATTLTAFASPALFLTRIGAEMALGRPMTLATLQSVDNPLLTANHAYSVSDVLRNPAGKVTGVRLRNPVGSGGSAGSGYIDLSGGEAMAALRALVVARG